MGFDACLWKRISCSFPCGWCLGYIDDVLRESHFEERLEKRERRLRAAVLVRSIGVQPVPAGAGRGVVERDAEVVVAEEPVEGAVRLLTPLAVAGRAQRFEGGGDRRLRLHRLLIEARARAGARIEAVRADRHEVAFRALERRQPRERLERAVAHGLAA